MNKKATAASLAASLVLIYATGNLGADDEEGLPFPDSTSPEIWVDGPANVQPGTDRNFPAVAVDDFGRRVHVWNAFLSSSNPPRNDIMMRRLDPAGNPEMDPFLVNTYTTNTQDRARVAASSDGSFLVVWGSQERNLADTADRTWVRSQAFDANASPVGSEQLLSTLSPERPTEASVDVAALRTSDGGPGGFVVVWESGLTYGNDTGVSIQARLVSPNGSPFGAQFQVNSSTPGSQTDSTVTELADGGFLVVWEDVALQLQGRRFNGAGDPVGGQFTISTAFEQSHSRPDVAIGWNNQIAVVWEDDDEPGAELGDEIRARILDPEGTPLGADFRVNTLTLDGQGNPSVAGYGTKGFLVVWNSDTSVGDDNDLQSIQARVVSGPGTFDGPQVQYNTWTSTNQNRPHAGGWYGRLSSNWRSNGNTETTDDVITARDIEHCLFCDDFEWFSPASSGNLWRWSNSQGVVGRPDVTESD